MALLYFAPLNYTVFCRWRSPQVICKRSLFSRIYSCLIWATCVCLLLLLKLKLDMDPHISWTCVCMRVHTVSAFSTFTCMLLVNSLVSAVAVSVRMLFTKSPSEAHFLPTSYSDGSSYTNNTKRNIRWHTASFTIPGHFSEDIVTGDFIQKAFTSFKRGFLYLIFCPPVFAKVAGKQSKHT